MSSTYNMDPEHAGRLMSYLEDVRKHLMWHEKHHPTNRPNIQHMLGITELRIALLQAIILRQMEHKL
jgi:hypothetical protein